MAWTFLQAVNSTLRRIELIDSSGDLTSFTDSARQQDIDMVTAAWQEVVDHVLIDGDFPEETKLGTITLATSDRDYAVPADFKHMPPDSVFVDRTNGHVLRPYPGGFAKLFRDQLQPDNYTGQPQHWCFDEDGEIYLDYIPTADENGDVYTFIYNKEVTVTATTDTFPFVDAAVRALVPAVAEIYRRDKRKEFDGPMFQASIARAMKHINRGGKRAKW